MASRREGLKKINESPKSTSTVMMRVDDLSDTIKKLSDRLVKYYCGELDSEIKSIRNILDNSRTLSDSELEFEILSIANLLYFVGSAQENLGIKEDICKSIRQEVYSEARMNATGKTIADKTDLAERMAQMETITLSIYSRAYKKVKLKVEAGYEMLNSLKKIMNKRIAEMELSNSRYINHSGGDSDV